MPASPEWIGLVPADGIEPVGGHSLFYVDSGERPFPSLGFLARMHVVALPGGGHAILQVSSYSFTPTQERFAWLVRNGLPLGIRGHSGAMVPLANADIDAAIAAERVAA